ncbi:uncharacterized protein [Ptychodera flava]|uniref:uncharacterized protein n=1 Tax=Ptychodera flava TaxID=63121 RepID=UPI00396AA88B
MAAREESPRRDRKVIPDQLGARLDVTFFNGKATPSFSGNVFIAGFSAGDTISTVGTSFTFGRILDTGTGSDLPIDRYENFGGYSRRLHLHDGVDRSGVYYCDANANTGETERLQTVLIAEEAEIRPKCQTKTVSWGDDVTLTMMTSISETLLQWRHDGIQKSEWTGQSSIMISFAKTSDAGIYECYSSESQQNQGKHGFMRLIVRGCPNGKWGLPDCLFSCPTCYNGGMCNSDTGECICPPGFRGTNCETGCGKNRWGMTCGRMCSSGNSDGCRSTMYCIADPYGCSCSASYGGLDCAIDCPSRKYGSGCTQTCHCVNGCDGATGECNSGSACEQGWSGSKCHIPDSCPVGFYGELCNYKCHCKDNAACDKATGTCSNGECAPGWINVLTDCQQDGSLQIRALYNVKVNPGEQTNIICEVVGNPPASPNVVTLVDQSGSAITRTDHYLSGMYLSISNYSTSTVDNGLPYTCRVGEQTKVLTTFETYDGSLQIRALYNVKVNPGEQTNIICGVVGNPPASANDVTLVDQSGSAITRTDHNLSGMYLSISTYSTSTVDNGLPYTCRVGNQSKELTTFETYVTVKRPGPLGEGSKETYSTAITLCDVPSRGPTITGTTSSHPNALQVIWVEIKHTDKYVKVIVPDNSSREFIVAGLQAFTEYELILSFNNRDEQSPWSPVYKAIMAEDDEKQDKPKEGVPDDGHEYAYVNVSTQQSTGLTSTPKYQNREKDNEEELYTVVVEEKVSDEYADVDVSTQQSTGLTSTPIYQNSENDNEEDPYTVVVEEMVSDEYAYVNVSTQQSTGLTSTPKYQNREKDNEEGLYTGLVKEMQSESEYTSLSTSARNTDTKN